MQIISPTKLMTATSPGSRWQLQAGCLTTPLLGQTLTFTLSASPFLIIHAPNRAHPHSPAQSWAVRINHGPWQRFPAGAPVTFALPAVAHITLMTAGNCDLDQVWTGHQGFALQALTCADHAQWSPQPPTPVATIIGDSITAGCWVAGKHASADYRPESNYVGIASDLLPQPLNRIAYSAAGFVRPGAGGVPPALAWLTQTDATHLAPAIQTPWLIVALGVNDRRYPRRQVQRAMATYFRQLATVTTSQIALMIPFAQTWAPELRAFGQQFHWPVIETAAWSASTIDGLHPDQAGSLTLGHHFAHALQRLAQVSAD